MNQNQTAQAVARVAAVLFSPNDTHEIRILHTPKGTVSGYFTRPDALAQAAANWSGKADSVYFTLNPTKLDLLARSDNRLKEWVKNTTSDGDILRRRWLLVDFDAVRPAGISSTDAEHRAALNRAADCGAWLAETFGWQSVLSADSGNGGHLLVRVDLPNDAAAGTLCETVLKTLAQKYDDGAVVVDTTTFNAARICTLYGTMKCKGDSTADRPHRPARLFEPLPDCSVPVTRDQLQAVADLFVEPAPPHRPAAASSRFDNGPFDMVGFIAKHGLVTEPGQAYKGGMKWQMDCYFDPSHKSPDAWLGVTAAGAACYKCSHNSCQSNDWHALRERLEPSAARAKSKAASADGGEPEEEGEGRGPSVATRLVQIGQERAQLWHTDDLVPYATVPVDGHNETWEVESTGFRDHLAQVFYKETGRAIAANAMQSAVSMLAMIARQNDDQREVFLRKADLSQTKGTIYLDLCNDKWQAVKITADGWEVVDKCPVAFRRARGALPLPFPVRGGSLAELRDFINMPTGDDGGDILIFAWLLACLGPHRSYPILHLMGEQGTAKSWAARLLRSLVDPAKTDLRRDPKEDRDIAIAAKNGFVVAYDNVSGFPQWLSDTLCTLSTGGGFGTRKLHTNDDEALFNFMCPVLMTGIGEPSTKPDFLQRALLVSLPVITEARRKDEADVEPAFAAARPRLLGALLDAVSCGLRNFKKTQLAEKPRMADFARWVSACEPACPWPAGAFLEAYHENQAAGGETALDADKIAPLIIRLVENNSETPGLWRGSPSELLATLGNMASEQERPGLPKMARSLTVALKRISPALRTEKNIHFTEPVKETGGKRVLTLKIVDPDSGANSGAKSEKGAQTVAQTVLGETQNKPFDDAGASGVAQSGAKAQNTPPSSAAEFLNKKKEREEEGQKEAGQFRRGENTAEFAPFAPLRPEGVASLLSLSELTERERARFPILAENITTSSGFVWIVFDDQQVGHFDDVTDEFRCAASIAPEHRMRLVAAGVLNGATAPPAGGSA